MMRIPKRTLRDSHIIYYNVRNTCETILRYRLSIAHVVSGSPLKMRIDVQEQQDYLRPERFVMQTKD